MKRILAGIAAAGAICAAPGLSAGPVAVHAGNFARAETDRYFALTASAQGLGKLVHGRRITSVDDQPVIRMNLDTLYSQALFDLDAGPVTVTIPPPADGRYAAVEVVNQDHYAPAVLHEGTHVLTREGVGTRYMSLLLRVFTDPGDPADLEKAHAVQDSVSVAQDGTGSFEVPDWDQASLDKARKAILDLAALGTPEGVRRMGRKDEVDPVAHLLVTAGGWGLNPESEALYYGAYPAQNDGVTVHSLTLRDVPADGFWSVSVYNADGFFEKNDLGRYSVNNVSAETGSDGAVTIQFGGCAGDSANCIPITDGWNYVLRLYRPRENALSGAWQPPEPEPQG